MRLEGQNWINERDVLPDFDEMLSDVTDWSDEQNKYPFRRTTTYNLLLMGKTRTGKTTVAKVLENPCYVPPDARLHSETKQVTIHPVATTNIDDQRIFCFNIIDTPGMFDRVKKESKSLTNEKIKAAIDKCINDDVTNIHLFAFVISCQSNLDREDIQSMIFVKDNYPFLHDYIALIVTHCEETNDEQRHMKVAEFFESEQVARHNLREFFGKRIFFMGSLRPELRVFPNRQCVRQQIRNVHQMREILIEYLIHLDPKNSFNIHRVGLDSSCSIL